MPHERIALTQFDFRNEEDQNKFEQLAEEQRSDVISRQQTEAERVNERGVDSYLVQMRLASVKHDPQLMERFARLYQEGIQRDIRVLDKNVEQALDAISAAVAELAGADVASIEASWQNVEAAANVAGFDAIRLSGDAPDAIGYSLGRMSGRDLFVRRGASGFPEVVLRESKDLSDSAIGESGRRCLEWTEKIGRLAEGIIPNEGNTAALAEVADLLHGIAAEAAGDISLARLAQVSRLLRIPVENPITDTSNILAVIKNTYRELMLALGEVASSRPASNNQV